MATDLLSCYHADEDYIDMEVSSPSNFFFDSINTTPTQTREFEFQMSLNSHEREPTTSPADELFYKGQLLPLHLPPRLQMVQKLLQSSNTTFEDEQYNTPFITTPSTNTCTPLLESCNISPSESCRVSSELNPDEYFFEWSTELSSFIGDHPKKSWSEMIKQSSLGQKLKASRAYLKSPTTLANVLMKSIDKEVAEDGVNSHRRSFSGAIKHSATKCSSSSSSGATSSSSSSSFSFNSNGFYDLQFLKRSSSANLENEGAIEGAIAHCKQSQQFCSLSASRIAVSGDKER